MDPSKREGELIALNWYDGPLLEVARVQYPDYCLVKVVTNLCKIEGKEPWRQATILFTKDELLKMLDLVEGKPIEDFHGDLYSAYGEKIDMDIAIEAAEDAGYATVKT